MCEMFYHYEEKEHPKLQKNQINLISADIFDL